MAGDWAQELFVRHGELFQIVLEQLLDRATEEVHGLADLLQARGVGAGATVLDLNCGIGRHAVCLAGLGYRVVGTDMSPRYVERARELAGEHGVGHSSEFVVVDARRVGEALLGRNFDAVVNMDTSLGYYDYETDRSILRQCRDLTRSGGVFVLETGFRDCLSRSFQPTKVTRVRRLLLLEEGKLNLETSRLERVWTFLEEVGQGYGLRAEVRLDQRFYALHELIALFGDAGWHYSAAYRDFELHEPSLDGDHLIVVCQAP